MHGKVKHTISISLVVILLLPMTIKFFDGLFHHHDNFQCTAKNEKHFHKYHKKCPIPSFELSIFSAEEDKQTSRKNNYSVEQIDNYNFIYYISNSKFSFLLRAPPIFSN